MTIHAFPIRPADLPSVQVETDYITQKHECTDLADFKPDECVPCVDCNHAECRHRVTAFPAPIDTTGMTPERALEAKRVEAMRLMSAMASTPCEVDGCDCTRMKCGDECPECGGDGHVEDERTGRTYTCLPCRGYGVVA